MKNEIKSTAHSKYRCEYHIVFAPKYRRKEIYGQVKKDIGEILRKLCEQKGVEIIEAEACPDHIHMLVSIPPHLSIAQFMGYLKGKSSLMIFDRHANLKYKYGQRSFWCRGYFVNKAKRHILYDCVYYYAANCLCCQLDGSFHRRLSLLCGNFRGNFCRCLACTVPELEAKDKENERSRQKRGRERIDVTDRKPNCLNCIIDI